MVECSSEIDEVSVRSDSLVNLVEFLEVFVWLRGAGGGCAGNGGGLLEKLFGNWL